MVFLDMRGVFAGNFVLPSFVMLFEWEPRRRRRDVPFASTKQHEQQSIPPL